MFCQAWVVWLKNNNFSEKEHTLDEITSYDWFSKHYGTKSKQFFLENPFNTYTNLIKPIPNSVEFIEWAKNHFKVRILTHACKKETEEAKLFFCKKYFGLNESEVDFFPLIEDKYKFIKDDDILIDDYPIHILNQIAKNKKIGIIFNFEGNNGWSKLERYDLLKDQLKIKQHIPVATNYIELQKILERYI